MDEVVERRKRKEGECDDFGRRNLLTRLRNLDEVCVLREEGQFEGGNAKVENRGFHTSLRHELAFSLFISRLALGCYYRTERSNINLLCLQLRSVEKKERQGIKQGYRALKIRGKLGVPAKRVGIRCECLHGSGVPTFWRRLLCTSGCERDDARESATKFFGALARLGCRVRKCAPKHGSLERSGRHGLMHAGMCSKAGQSVVSKLTRRLVISTCVIALLLTSSTAVTFLSEMVIHSQPVIHVRMLFRQPTPTPTPIAPRTQGAAKPVAVRHT